MEDETVYDSEADLPCSICGSELFTRANDMLKCKMCKIVVHQGAQLLPAACCALAKSTTV